MIDVVANRARRLTPPPRFPVVCRIAVLSGLLGDVVASKHIGGQHVSAFWTACAAVVIVTLLPAETMLQATEQEFRRAPLLEERLARARIRVPGVFWAFLFWAVTVSAISGFDRIGIQNLLSYFVLIGGAALAAATSSRHTGQRLMKILLVVAWIRAIAYIPDALLLLTRGHTLLFAGRSYAIVSIVLIAVAVSAHPRTKSSRALSYLLFAEILVTGSRTASVAAALILTFVVMHGRKRGQLLRGITISALLLGMGWALVTEVPAAHNRVFSGDHASVHGFTINTEGRAAIWPAVIKAARRNPWTGSGAGTATAAARANHAEGGEPHNDYLRLWADFGYIGAVLWVVGAALTLVRCWRRASMREGVDAQLHRCAFLALAGTLVVAITDNVLIYSFSLLPLAALIGTSLAHSPAPETVRDLSAVWTFDDPTAASRGSIGPPLPVQP